MPMDDRRYREDDTTQIFVPPVDVQDIPVPVPRRPPKEKTVTALPKEGLWDASHVAQYLKVSRSWVYHRAEAGLLPCLRVGGLLRFDPEVVRAFTQKR